MRNLDPTYRITCQYRTRDQNCNFRKFKMADGRHLEKPWIIRFRSSLVYRCNFRFRAWKFDKKENFQIQDGGRTPYWISFFGYITAPYWPMNAKFGKIDEESHANTGHVSDVTKTEIFENSRWRTAAILKIALSTYLSRDLSDFDQIWYTGANFHSKHGNFDKKNRNFSNSRWRTDAILKIVFLAI